MHGIKHSVLRFPLAAFFAITYLVKHCIIIIDYGELQFILFRHVNFIKEISLPGTVTWEAVMTGGQLH